MPQGGCKPCFHSNLCLHPSKFFDFISSWDCFSTALINFQVELSSSMLDNSLLFNLRWRAALVCVCVRFAMHCVDSFPKSADNVCGFLFFLHTVKNSQSSRYALTRKALVFEYSPSFPKLLCFLLPERDALLIHVTCSYLLGGWKFGRASERQLEKRKSFVNDNIHFIASTTISSLLLLTATVSRSLMSSYSAPVINKSICFQPSSS